MLLKTIWSTYHLFILSRYIVINNRQKERRVVDNFILFFILSLLLLWVGSHKFRFCKVLKHLFFYCIVVVVVKQGLGDYHWWKPMLETSFWVGNFEKKNHHGGARRGVVIMARGFSTTLKWCGACVAFHPLQIASKSFHDIAHHFKDFPPGGLRS